MIEDHKLAWFKINADGALVSALAILNVFDLISPESSELSVALGFVPPAFWIWTTCYVLGGVLMIYSFVFHKLGPEYFGRVLVLIAVGMETWREGLVYGFDDPDVVQRLLVTLGIAVFFGFRLNVLLARAPVAFVIPGRRE